MASIEITPSGKYLLRWRDAGGRSRSKTYVSKKAAEDSKKIVEAESLRGELIDLGAAKKVLHWYAQDWIRGLTVKNKTREGYRVAYNSYVLPRFGNVQVGKIKPVDVREWAMKITEAKALGGMGLSESSRYQAVSALRQILDYAVDSGAIRANPAKGLRLPKSQVKSERMYLSVAQVKDLVAAIDPYWALAIKTAVFSGLRAGELWGLRAGDMDVHNSTLNIRRNLVQLSSRWELTTPKSNRGRSVPIPRWLMDELVTCVGGKEDDAAIFTGPKGGFVNHNNFARKHFRPAAEQVGLKGLHFHDLRHTYAALLIHMGAQPKVIQERMGHASIAITLDLYGHVYPDRHEELTEALGHLYETTASPLGAAETLEIEAVAPPLRDQQHDA